MSVGIVIPENWLQRDRKTHQELGNIDLRNEKDIIVFLIELNQNALYLVSWIFLYMSCSFYLKSC